MASTAVVKATAEDADACVAALVMAFSTDPLMRWVFPEPYLYLSCFQAMATVIAESSIATGSAYRSADCSAAALWLPPRAGPNRDAMERILEAGLPAERKQEIYATFDAMRNTHPTEEHWYLSMLGVDLTRQGMGYGSALLERSLEPCDRDHLPAFLVSTNARNLPLYERYGFQVTGTVRSGTSPTVWPMLRPAR
jgi:GNAT superfamily N-acetyltransferase